MPNPLKKWLPASWQRSRIWEKPNKEAQQRLAFEQRLLFKNQPRRFPSLGQFKYISSFFSARERLVVIASSLVFVGAVVAMGVAVYGSFVVQVPASGGAYREGVVGTPLYINPILATTNDVDLDITHLVYAGLLRQNKDLQLEPDLAESWSVSDDQKTYTLKLRDGVYWHDGKPVTIQDVLFTMHAIQDPTLNSPLYLSFQGVDVQSPDDHTVTFTLPQPYAPFASLLTTGILPEHIWGNIPTSTMRLAEYNLKPIGDGAWKFEKLEKDKQGNLYSYTVVPADNGEKLPLLDSITFTFFTDYDSEIDALNSKKIDGMSFVPRQLITQITNAQNYKTEHLQLPQYTALFFNIKNNPALKDQSVRQAIAYSIDRHRLIQEALDGLATVINEPLLPGMTGYDQDLEGYPYNAVEAQRLLDEAGWKAITVDDYVKAETDILRKQNPKEEPQVDTGDQAVFRQKGNEFLTLKLTAVDQPENKRAAELLKNALQTIGFKVDLEIVSVPTLTNQVLPQRDYEALLYGQILNPIPDLYPFWDSSQINAPGLNLAGFSDKNADKLLEQARTTTSEATRADLYTQFVKLLDKDTNTVFLYSPQYTYLLPTKIHGFDTERIGIPADRFVDAADWYIKTRPQFQWK